MTLKAFGDNTPISLNLNILVWDECGLEAVIYTVYLSRHEGGVQAL